MAVLIGLLLLILLLGVYLLNRPVSMNVTVEGGKAKVGAMAPDFTSKTIDGATLRLSSYRGRPVLLNFWATWCPPCHDEMPLLQRSYDVDRALGLAVIGVDYEETNAASMKAFLKKVDARFPTVYDPAGQIATEYGVNVGLPVSIFIDKAGKVEFIQLGQMSSDILRQHLQSIL